MNLDGNMQHLSSSRNWHNAAQLSMWELWDISGWSQTAASTPWSNYGWSEKQFLSVRHQISDIRSWSPLPLSSALGQRRRNVVQYASNWKDHRAPCLHLSSGHRYGLIPHYKEVNIMEAIKASSKSRRNLPTAHNGMECRHCRPLTWINTIDFRHSMRGGRCVDTFSSQVWIHTSVNLTMWSCVTLIITSSADRDSTALYDRIGLED